MVSPGLLRPQSRGGGLRVVVKDPAGAVIPEAKIVITNQSSGASRTALADRDGEARIEDLDPGIYTVEVARTCFKKSTKPDLRISLEAITDLSITLDLCWVGWHLSSDLPNFSVRAERLAKDDFQQSLIAKTESLPCHEGTPQEREMIGKEIPTCVNRESFLKVSELVQRNKQGKLPEAGEGPVTAKAYYGGVVEQDGARKKWIVKLRLEYAVTCGNLCGIGVVRTRKVVFDEGGNIVNVVEGDDCDCAWIS